MHLRLQWNQKIDEQQITLHDADQEQAKIGIVDNLHLE